MLLCNLRTRGISSVFGLLGPLHGGVTPRHAMHPLYTLLESCVFLLAIADANRLSCVCNLSECENVKEEDCPSGAATVWDSCKCCRICARVENEPCGGPFGFSGSCATGLECVLTADLLDRNAVGVCTRISAKDTRCQHPKTVSGCNIVDMACRCELAQMCADEKTPFHFATRRECWLNLRTMLERKRSEEDAEDEYGNSLDQHDAHRTAWKWRKNSFSHKAEVNKLVGSLSETGR